MESHLGRWQGQNKLWFEDPEQAELSEGSIEVLGEHELTYTWVFRGEPQRGRIRLSGAADATRATFEDTWHQRERPLVLAGTREGQRVSVQAAYTPEPAWRWRIELDWSAPDRFALHMLNIDPQGTETPAVELIGRRA